MGVYDLAICGDGRNGKNDLDRKDRVNLGIYIVEKVVLNSRHQSSLMEIGVNGEHATEPTVEEEILSIVHVSLIRFRPYDVLVKVHPGT